MNDIYKKTENLVKAKGYTPTQAWKIGMGVTVCEIKSNNPYNSLLRVNTSTEEVANLFPTIQQIKEIQSIQAYQY